MTIPDTSGRGMRPWGLLGATVAAFALVALVVAGTLILDAAGRAGPPPTSTIARVVPAGQATASGSALPPLSGVTVSDIATNPDRFTGETLTFWGEVDAILGMRAFTVGDGDFVGDDRLLVLSAEPLPVITGRTPDSPLIEDDLVRLTGAIRLFDRAEAERELGVGLDDPHFADWIGRPALVARSLRLTPREYTAGVARVPVSTADLVAVPGTFTDREVNVTGQITRILGPESFVLNDQVLVTYSRGPVPDRPPEVGQFVIATGPFRLFDLPAFEGEIGRDLPDDAFAPFTGKPAVVAASIRPAD